MSFLKQHNAFSIEIVVIKVCREDILLHSFNRFIGIVFFTYIVSYMVILIFNLYTRNKAYLHSDGILGTLLEAWAEWR